jgi:hypothetical protein
MDTINHTESNSNVSSKAKTDTRPRNLTDICFGDLSREEINKVLTLADVPLNPPTKVSKMGNDFVGRMAQSDNATFK